MGELTARHPFARALTVRGHEIRARVMFGPHETNLGRGRAISDRHVAYYAARAAGGAGLIVTETASVTADDWPYERAPLAAECGPGWRAVAEACRPYGAVLLAGLGHAGGQGSTACSQSVLWAPSPVADAASRELPAELEQPGIDELVAGFAAAAGTAVAAGLAGVEIDAGPVSLLRQFHSGLTNQRGDDYGTDRLRLTRQVLAACRTAVGDRGIVALRLSCDELAPWAGVTPDHAAEQVDALAAALDLLVVVRGGPYSTTAYRPTAHTPPGFNRDLTRRMRVAAAGRVPVVLQGSVVDADAAATALTDGTADLVEMTRAQIADPNLVRHAVAGQPERIRPCILCNQVCRVRDNRNPIVSCVGEPRSGHETTDPPVDPPPATGADDPAGDPGRRRPVLVVGGGVAGLECARVLAGHGHPVRLAERADQLGGTVRAAAAGPGRGRMVLLAAWLEAECRRLGVEVETGTEVDERAVAAFDRAGGAVVLATGSASPTPRPVSGAGTVALDVLDVLRGGLAAVPPGEIVIDDPIGGPIGVGAAEWLAGAGRSVALVTPDPIAGTLLSLSGDLAPVNTRLAQAGVRRAARARLRGVGAGRAVLEDVWTGERREIPCAVLVDAGPRRPEESLYRARAAAAGPAAAPLPRAGDCVAPRGIGEAVLEGRRRALELLAGESAPGNARAGATGPSAMARAATR